MPANASSASAPAAAAKKAPPAAGAKPKAPPPPPASGLDTFKYKHTPEDAENLAAELIPANIATGFGDANWKTRLAALEEMTSWVEKEVGALDAEVVVRFIAKKGWAEKNFQVRTPLLSQVYIVEFNDFRSHQRYMVSSLPLRSRIRCLEDLAVPFA